MNIQKSKDFWLINNNQFKDIMGGKKKTLLIIAHQRWENLKIYVKRNVQTVYKENFKILLKDTN